MPVSIQVLPRVADARGWLCEPLDANELAAQRNVHVVVTEPGHVRGNHYHTRATEWLILVGPALVRLREAGQVTDHLVPAGECHRLTLPPGVAHAVLNTGTAPAWSISFTDRVHDRAAPDTVREVLIETHPVSAGRPGEPTSPRT